jgi:hypothetical protein
MPDMLLLKAKLKQIVDQEASRPEVLDDYDAGVCDGTLKLAKELLKDFFAVK